MRAIESANPDTLPGVFGDGDWGNKNLLPDSTLADLIEHFSTKTLSIANLPEDELGNGYEYLIKKFADDSGHTAQEFYTNRTLVHLMTLMLEPQPGESVYDPTCGTGGMLISAAAELKRQGKEWRNLRLYGQELNYGTSAIARMNLFLHGITDGHIAHGDTLTRPAFLDATGGLQTFDVVLANPPYSIKAWNRDSVRQGPLRPQHMGRPAQGRADYAFFQHIAKSLDPETGRAAILFPHGVLFRRDEAALRESVGEVRPRRVRSRAWRRALLQLPHGGCRRDFCGCQKPAERRGRCFSSTPSTRSPGSRRNRSSARQHQTKILDAYRGFVDDRTASRPSRRSTRSPRRVTAWPFRCTSTAARAADAGGAGRCRGCAGRTGVRRRARPMPPSATSSLCSERRWHGMSLNLDKSTWKRVSLGDVVRHVTDRVDPETSALERFLAGEHIPSGSLAITDWGVIGRDPMGSMFYKRFKPGHVLYVSRRDLPAQGRRSGLRGHHLASKTLRARGARPGLLAAASSCRSCYPLSVFHRIRDP